MFLHDTTQPTEHDFALGIQFILFISVLLCSLIVNLVMLFICVGPIYGTCRARLRKRELSTIPTNSNGALRILARQAFLPLGKPSSTHLSCRRVSSYLSSASFPVSTRPQCKFRAHHKLEPFETNVKKIGRFTRYYFGSLCLANVILASLAMPFSIAACVSMKLTSTWNDDPVIKQWNNYSVFKSVESSQYGFRIVHTVLVNYITCAFIESTVSGVTMAMILSLVHLTADRLIAICKPLHYPRWVTKKRAILSIFTLWLASFAMVIIPYLWEKFSPRLNPNQSSPVELDSDIMTCFIMGQHSRTKHQKFVICFFVFVYLLPVLFIIIAYCQIYLQVRRFTQYMDYHTPKHKVTFELEHSQSSSRFPTPRLSIQNEPDLSCSNGQSLSVFSGTSINRQHSWAYFVYKSRDRQSSVNKLDKQRTQNAETKAAKTAFILVSTFTILTAPYFFYVLLGASKTSNCQNSVSLARTLASNITTTALNNMSSLSSSLQDIEIGVNQSALSNCNWIELATSIIVWLLYLNSILTPCLYAHRDGVLKHRIYHIWIALRCPVRVSPASSIRRSLTP